VTAHEQLEVAAKLRIPRIPREEGSQARLNALEDHMIEATYQRADLMEARLEVYGSVRELKEAWDHIEGYQALKRTKTEAAVDDAKRQLRPDLYDGIRKGEWLIARLTEQIDRLDRETYICSRAYTFATGG
jgi:hypothetical protein